MVCKVDFQSTVAIDEFETDDLLIRTKTKGVWVWSEANLNEYNFYWSININEKQNQTLNGEKTCARISLKSVVKAFLGNHRKECRTFGNRFVNNIKIMGWWMSLKIHFIHCHFSFFLQILEELLMNKWEFIRMWKD